MLTYPVIHSAAYMYPAIFLSEINDCIDRVYILTLHNNATSIPGNHPRPHGSNTGGLNTDATDLTYIDTPARFYSGVTFP